MRTPVISRLSSENKTIQDMSVTNNIFIFWNKIQALQELNKRKHIRSLNKWWCTSVVFSSWQQLLVTLPNDDQALDIAARQQAFVVIESDPQNGTCVTLQLVHALVALTLDIQEVYAAILAPCHCWHTTNFTHNPLLSSAVPTCGSNHGPLQDAGVLIFKSYLTWRKKKSKGFFRLNSFPCIFWEWESIFLRN